MKIYIVDDEIMIIEMLKRLIDWNSLHMELAGTAQNGIAAMEEIERLKPDIVITDIRMPGYDGLTLIQKTSELGLDCQFIVISGYKHFEYAQGAIKYGVKDYLLKPIKADELNQLLANIRAAKLASETTQSEVVHMKQNIREKMHHLLMSSIADKTFAGGKSLALTNHEYYTEFADGHFLCFLIRIDCAHIAPEFHNSMNAEIAASCEGLIQPYCKEVIYANRQDESLFLINYTDPDAVKKPFQNMLQKSIDYLSRFGKIYITFGLGTPVHTLDEIISSYDGAQKAIHNRILFGINNVLCAPPDANPALVDALFSNDEKKYMANCIERLDFSMLEEQVRTLFSLLKAETGDNAEYYWILCEQINQFFGSAVEHLDVDKDVLVTNDTLDKRLENCMNPNDVVKVLLDSTIHQFVKHFNFENSSSSAAISIAKQYISEHYAEKLSLNDLSAKVYLNPVYFSVLFKRETGTNFTDYVNEYRVAQSKELLKRLDLSLADVAQEVGIRDSRYFSKLFRKFVGITPTEYRKIHARGYKD